MTTSSEDVLGELYAWDTTIDEMYERGVDHADFDEDEALEAYEEMIQVGAAPAGTHGDAVLSLAAQVLTKHFYKFPHVHMNVLDVLLDLCDPARAQPVRIHSVRSLLQIVKGAASTTPPLVPACRDRIATHVAKLIKHEASSVIVRTLTQLQETLESVDAELKKTERRERWKEKKNEQPRGRNDYDDRHEETPRRSDDEYRRQKEDQEREERRREEYRREEAAKRERREARFGVAAHDPVDGNNESDSTRREAPQSESFDTRDQKRRDSYREDRGYNDRGASHHERNSSSYAPRDDSTRERRPSNTKEGTGNGCPPSSFIFIGGVPRSTYHEDIINYLACIDESVTHSCVQIKFPNANPTAAGYAFVSLESVEHARKAIRHIQTTEFNGRNLIGDFARGPPCATLQFVERNGSHSMHDTDAVLPVDVDTLEPSVWDELCASLKQFGSLEILRDGRFRFRETESAKSVIRKHRFFIAGREFLPVYDPEEQAEIDSSRRRRRNEEENANRRGDGLSRYGGTDGRERRGSRDDSERKRRRSQSFERDQKDKLPRRDHFDDKGDHHHHVRREFDQARYGPRDSPADKHRDDKPGSDEFANRHDRRASRGNELKHDHRGRDSEPHGSRRGSSRSPAHHDSQDKRGRSRSPGKRFSVRGTGKIDESRHSRSPARSATSSKHGRGEFDGHRPRRESSFTHRDEADGRHDNRDQGGSYNGDSSHRRDNQRKHGHDSRRSRSPTHRSDYATDRRPHEAARNDDRVQHHSRGRSTSPRRMVPPHVNGNDGYVKNAGYNREEPRRDYDRSRGQDDRGNGRSEFSRRTDDQYAGGRREQHREQRFDGDERGHHGNGQQHVSKYGTIGGHDHSPSPHHFKRDEANPKAYGHTRDHDRFGRGGDDHHKKPFVEGGNHRYGNENYSRENRDRHSNPPRDFQHNRDDKQQNYQRGRSPPKNRPDREQFDSDDRRRSRSPSPFKGHKKPRGHSPRRDDGAKHYEQRSQRFEEHPRRKYDKPDRQFDRSNGNESRSRYESKYRDDHSREDRRGRTREQSEMTSARTETRESDRRQRSQSGHSSRDQRTRTPSPVVDEDVVMDDAEGRPESPLATGKDAQSSTYEDIDECTVDYEEDEE